MHLFQGFILVFYFLSEMDRSVFVFVFSLKIWNASRICVSSLRRGHANLLCIVPILVYVLRKRALFLLLNIRRIFVFMLTLSLGTPKMLLKLSLYLHKLPERHYHGTFYLRKINEIEFK